jgi:hypothetical protein
MTVLERIRGRVWTSRNIDLDPREQRSARIPLISEDPRTRTIKSLIRVFDPARRSASSTSARSKAA